MTHKTYDALKLQLENLCNRTTDEKGPAYTGESKDMLANFKSMANRFNISPIIVWAIYFNKHVDAVNSFIKNPSLSQGSEPIESRFVDIINYSYLGYALLEDEREKLENIYKDSATDSTVVRNIIAEFVR